MSTTTMTPTSFTDRLAQPPMTVARLGEIARRIDLDNAAEIEAELNDVVIAARALDLSPVLVMVLADRDEPAVARHRAFGRLAVAIERALASRGLTGVGDDASSNRSVTSALGSTVTSPAAA
jgi:hypothetical protein